MVLIDEYDRTFTEVHEFSPDWRDADEEYPVTVNAGWVDLCDPDAYDREQEFSQWPTEEW